MTAITANLRPARSADVSALVSLAEQLGYPCRTEVMAERLHELSLRRDHAILVAEVDQVGVVGWIHIFVRPLLITERAAEIGGLVVDAEFRSQGIGELLLDAAEAWAVQAGYLRLRVRSNVVRKRAHTFYEHRDYKRIKSQWVFEKTLGGPVQEECG